MLGHLRAVCCGERGRSTCRGRLPPLRTPAVVPVADDSDDDVPLSVLAALGPPDGRRCSIVHYCAVVWSIAQYCAILHTTAQYCAVLHSNAQYCAVVYCAVLCSAVQYGRCCTARRLLSLLSLLGSSFKKNLKFFLKELPSKLSKLSRRRAVQRRPYCTALHSTAQYCTVLHSTAQPARCAAAPVLRSTELHCVAQYCTAGQPRHVPEHVGMAVSRPSGGPHPPAPPCPLPRRRPGKEPPFCLGKDRPCPRKQMHCFYFPKKLRKFHGFVSENAEKHSRQFGEV